jgi:glycosyltransferase involved in cell wall biosynthesis
MDKPLVSVIIPAYNAEAFIEQTLESVLTQTYENLEVLVVDDGSTDQTAAIVTRIASRDPRLRLLHQQNAGVAAARNLAIQQSTGEFIAPIDADDLWYPQNLEKQVNCLFHSDPGVGVVYSWSSDVDKEGAPLDGYHTSTVEGGVFITLLCHNFIGNASATLIRKACLDQVGGYNTYFKEQNAQGCEDWDLYLRLAEHYRFRVVPEFLVGYRKISSSMSRDYGKMARSHALMIELALTRKLEIPAVVFQLSRSSFYLYLAQQSRQGSCYKGTLYWLLEAIKADQVTPLLRLGVYGLILESFVRLTLKEVAAWVGPENFYWMKLKLFTKAALRHLSALLPQTQIQALGVKVKVLVSSGLHRSMPFLIGNSKP